MLDTGKARQNADSCQANNPNEPACIPQMLIRKYNNSQYVPPSIGIYYYASQAVTISMLLHDATTETRSTLNDKRLARRNLIWLGVG
jgi:hypothetical protein